MARPDYSGMTYFDFDMTVYAMKATWVNSWLDEGKTVLGKTTEGGDEYVELDEMRPDLPFPEGKTKDGRWIRIYGYKVAEPAA